MKFVVHNSCLVRYHWLISNGIYYRSVTGDLYAMGRNWKAIDLNGSGPWKGSQREEFKYATIKLTEKLRCMDGSIIVCHYVDHHWVFVRLRKDSDLPNGKNALEGNASFSFY